MANPFTITVTVDSTNSLQFNGSGSGGGTISATDHKIFRNCDLIFTSPDGDLLIQFKGTKKPFQSPNNVADVIVTAARGASTPALTTKKSAWGPKTSYTAVVARPSGPPFLIFKDPELEDGGGLGGGPTKKKKAGKKVYKKKAKKK